MLACSHDSAQRFLHQYAPVETPGWIFTYIAIAAIVIHFLAEITQQDAPAADVGFAVPLHLFQFLQVHLALPALLGETSKHDQVAQRIEKQRVAPQAIPARPSDLLIIILDASRHVVMDDPAHVAFIDAHPESDRGAYHIHTVVDKVVLGFLAKRGR